LGVFARLEGQTVDVGDEQGEQAFGEDGADELVDLVGLRVGVG
jgi:hypothetical protein